MITTDEDYALFCTQKLADPSPLLARLRAQDPIHWSPTMNMWLVTRYDDVYSALHDTTRLSSSREGMYTDPLTESNRRRASRIINHILHWLENVDAPQHTRLRKLVNLAFTPRMVEVSRGYSKRDRGRAGITELLILYSGVIGREAEARRF